MTGPSKPTCHCARPILDNALLCDRCTGLLERDLGDVPALLAEVETTRMRQSRTGGGGVGVTSRSAERPLPFNDRPAAAAEALFAALRIWTELVVEHQGRGWPRDRSADMSRFLLASVGWLRRREEAAEAMEQITHAVHRLRATVDRPVDLTYAGICSATVPVLIDDVLTIAECPTHLYVPFGRRAVTCQVCGTKHDMGRRRDVLLKALEDQLAHIALLSKGLSNLGREVNESTVRSWVARDRLVPHGTDSAGRQLFRVGDVLDLLNEEAVRQTERDVKRAAKDEAKRRRAG